MQKFKKLLAANRSEIAIRVFRSTHELGIRTVAVYAYEDRYALHRFKADEAYQVGKKGEPIKSYLDIESLIQIACEKEIDAIHPGYGFLSENPDLVQACDEAGIKFVGPREEVLRELGDKTTARQLAKQAGVPILQGSMDPITDTGAAQKLAEELGYPIILKAAKGGGGRGMRVVTDPKDFTAQFEQARRESQTAFGSPDIFIEKFIRKARHIEVQILGDQHGNLVHLYERDCSVQRRHQKVVEIAPSFNLDPKTREGILESALMIGRAVRYDNAGTVEFLVDAETGDYYFIEVNPRIQVEHTVTEEVTGIDIVKAQIQIAQGAALTDTAINIPDQKSISVNGYAIQARVTTEDPMNNFMPDYGRLTHYRSASGMGIRLDAGSAFSGAVVNPYYDSLLVKVSARARKFVDASRRMERCLQEFRIRGVKTNIPFLIKLITHPDFVAGKCTTSFIDNTPELFVFPQRKDRASKILTYLGEIIVNGHPLVAGKPHSARRDPAPSPKFKKQLKVPAGYRQKLQELGPAKFGQWILEQKPLLFTDTTMRDAHQSLYATRFRTKDLLTVASAYAHLCPEMFSLEMWGGATFDTTMRFLKESPWDRLTLLREKIPNILFQMLLRASNAVGYTNYPDNVVQAFTKEAAAAGIDVFRVFDALNWVPNMRVAMEAVLETDSICEAAVCYTGDILDPKKSKYDLKYYVNLAKELEKMGAHILAIKDMAGVCKPAAAKRLVETLKQEIGIPIHFHTHDTSGVQASAIYNAAQVGLDIADGALAPMSGGTSQPNLNSVVESLHFTDRQSDLDTYHLDELAEYWRAVRDFYTPFKTEVLPASADLYRHAMPGGQYTNLHAQAAALGLDDRWPEVCEIYAEVNDMFGDIVKVTPTSKAVGDMALFMVANDLTPNDILNGDRELSYPASVLDLIGGRMGQPPGGFPAEVKKRILRDQPDVTDRPGETLPPADFAAAGAKVSKILNRSATDRDVLSYLLYPKVFEEYATHLKTYSNTSDLPTPVFFCGLEPAEEISVEIEPGKLLIIKYLAVGEPHSDGTRTVFFELNGQPRDVTVFDQSLEGDVVANVKADPDNTGHVGASMPGMVVMVNVSAGDLVKQGDKLLTLEAMKMETNITAEVHGKVLEVHVKPGSQVETGDLLVVIGE